MRVASRWRAVVGLLVLCAAVPFSVAVGEPLTKVGENLVTNGSFEAGTPDGKLPAGWRAAGVYARDAEVAQDGGASLRYVNRDPSRHQLCTQPLALKPGGRYWYRVMVKTLGIEGEDSGATVCVQWSDTKGQWLGGSFASGVKGTADWREVTGMATVPTNAGRCSISCYVRRGMTGEAWFDGVDVRRVIGPPMTSVLLAPNYRGRIPREGLEAACARVTVNYAEYGLAVHL